MPNKLIIWVVLGISMITHFAFFGHPNQTVFDEVHFGKFISGYYTHEYYFDIHPPLGKLMIAGFAKVFDFKPEFNFANIGEKFPDNKYLALRFLPSLAGTLLPVVIFLLALQLKFTPQGAFVAGLLVAIENALLVQTHYILMDGFLLLFGFSTLLFYFRRNFLWMAIFGGLTISIKWTGLTFLALPFLIELFKIYKQKEFKNVLKLPIYFLTVPLIIYFSVFIIHFSLLTKPGPGDAFMSPDFQNENVFNKFTELNLQMYQSNQRLTTSHPYGSQWYSWPFMTRAIFYWVSENSRIYLIGNPIIWWASTVAILMSLMYVLRHKVIKILLAGYLLNLLPFIGIKRVMFLYHYLTGLVFAILILVYLIERQNDSTWLTSKKIFIALIISSAIAFIYFAPLSYGLPLSPEAYGARVWLPSWR
ncbi:MAG: hypothetical protein UR98_C0004G0018 [Parcubacteria group bacterium GW2011_GWA1_36_12]|nr:MAG: hypothetical protein UR98_C0004G0018 [Parcubacteria group bacterium GW2011_GWA1_36_12]